MAISFNSDINSVMENLNASRATSSKAANVQSTLSNLKNLDKATDEELMQACKSFEAYLVEQVMTKVKEAVVPSEENENKYLSLFKSRLYEEYSNQIVENGELGLAQQLYEAMRRDYSKPSAK